MSLTSEIEKLDRAIQKAKSERDEAKGSLTASLNRLKKEFKLDSVEEAENHLTKMQTELEKLTKKARISLAKIKEDFEDVYAE